MAELAAKLARRRALNGEVDSDITPQETSHVVHSPERHTQHQKRTLSYEKVSAEVHCMNNKIGIDNTRIYTHDHTVVTQSIAVTNHTTSSSAAADTIITTSIQDNQENGLKEHVNGSVYLSEEEEMKAENVCDVTVAEASSETNTETTPNIETLSISEETVVGNTLSNDEPSSLSSCKDIVTNNEDDIVQKVVNTLPDEPVEVQQEVTNDVEISCVVPIEDHSAKIEVELDEVAVVVSSSIESQPSGSEAPTDAEMPPGEGPPSEISPVADTTRLTEELEDEPLSGSAEFNPQPTKEDNFDAPASAAEPPKGGKDELAELEDFFGKMNDDPYMQGLDLDLGLPSASPQNSTRTYSRDRTAGIGRNDSLFGDASDSLPVVMGSDEMFSLNTTGGPTLREVAKENSDLRAQATSLTHQLREREVRIAALQKELSVYRGQSSPGRGTPSESRYRSGEREEEDVYAVLRELGDGTSGAVSSPLSTRASKRVTRGAASALFGEDSDIPDNRDNARGAQKEDMVEMGLSGLSEQNEQLRAQMAFLQSEVKAKEAVIAELMAEVASVSHSRSKSNSIWSNNHDRKLSTLKHNLDDMGFDAGRVESMMEEMVDDSTVASAPFPDLSAEDRLNLDTLLFSDSGRNSGERRDSFKNSSLDSYATFLSSTSEYAGFMFQEQETKERSGSEAGLAQEKMDAHGLFEGQFSVDGDTQKQDTTSIKALFNDDNATATRARESQKKPNPNQNVYYYQEFINKLMHPESKNIVNAIRKFIESVLGPKRDCTPPEQGDKLDYEFHGMHRLADRCNDFMEAIVEHMRQDPVWGGQSDERYVSARDCLEKYIMTKLGKYAFMSVECPEEDEQLLRRMKLLAFVEAEALDIKPELRNDLVWTLARDELKKINSYHTPADKIACVTRCASVIFRSLNLARAKTDENLSESAPGADDFLPLLIWVVMHCHVPQLYSNCEYIQSFHNPVHLRGRAGYCFINMRSAMEFVSNLESDDLSMDPEEFRLKLEQSEKELASTLT